MPFSNVIALLTQPSFLCSFAAFSLRQTLCVNSGRNTAQSICCAVVFEIQTTLCPILIFIISPAISSFSFALLFPHTSQAQGDTNIVSKMHRYRAACDYYSYFFRSFGANFYFFICVLFYDYCHSQLQFMEIMLLRRQWMGSHKSRRCRHHSTALPLMRFAIVIADRMSVYNKMSASSLWLML